jgi:hypothetical protein
MLIYSNQRSKKRKLTTKQRELQSEWEELVNRTKMIFSTKKPPQKVNFTQKLSPKPFVRETEYYPSKDTGYYNTFRKPDRYYTGDNMKGIGTLHKSNAVPIFTDEEARDQANMRR